MAARSRLKDATDSRKSNFGGKPPLGHGHGVKPGGQSCWISKRRGLSSREQACWRKA
jgi:hypothetical protein